MLYHSAQDVTNNTKVLLLNKDKVKLNSYWVLGFVDAEGTFGSLK